MLLTSPCQPPRASRPAAGPAAEPIDHHRWHRCDTMAVLATIGLAGLLVMSAAPEASESDWQRFVFGISWAATAPLYLTFVGYGLGFVTLLALLTGCGCLCCFGACCGRSRALKRFEASVGPARISHPAVHCPSPVGCVIFRGLPCGVCRALNLCSDVPGRAIDRGKGLATGSTEVGEGSVQPIGRGLNLPDFGKELPEYGRSFIDCR